MRRSRSGSRGAFRRLLAFRPRGETSGVRSSPRRQLLHGYPGGELVRDRVPRSPPCVGRRPGLAPSPCVDEGGARRDALRAPHGCPPFAAGATPTREGTTRGTPPTKGGRYSGLAVHRARVRSATRGTLSRRTTCL